MRLGLPHTRAAAAVVGLAVIGSLCGQSASSRAAAPRRNAAPPLRYSGSPTVVATGIPFPSNLAWDSHGRLWATSGVSGRDPRDGVWYVPPGGKPRLVAKGLFTALGLVWVGNRLYVSHVAAPGNGQVSVLTGFTGHGFTSRRAVVSGLKVGRHTVNTIVRGPNGRLFVGVGSPSDNRKPAGHVLSFAPNGRDVVVEATGLRSAFGLAFHGAQLLVTDNARDDIQGAGPPDELNAFDPAGPLVDFGFPGCYDQGGSACAGKQAPFVRFPAHSTPAGVAVKGDVAFVADNGSAIPNNPVGRDIERVDLRTGQRTVFWRSPVEYDPLGIAIGPDGNLYAALYASGKIVRFNLKG